MDADDLRRLRQSLGLTQEEMAQRLRVARNTIARWERAEIGVPPYLDLAVRHLRPKQSFAEYVNQVIKEGRLTHQAVARQAQQKGAHISAAYINNVCNGSAVNPSIKVLKALAKGLGRSEREVFRAAGVDTGETWLEMEMGRFADMAKKYASLPAKNKQDLEAFIAALEHSINVASEQ